MENDSATRRLSPPSVATTTHSHARRRRRARDLLARISKLSTIFPEFRSLLADSLELLEQQIDRCPNSDRQMILSAIHLGAWTIEEITAETKLTRNEAQKILDQLLAAKIVLRKESQEKNPLGGRPKILWLPSPNFQPAP